MSSDDASGQQKEVERLLDDLSRLRLDPHRASLSYKICLALVAVLMLCLPLVYFAFVAAFGYWVVDSLATPPRSLGHVWQWLGYALLVVAGPMTLLFLIKPCFARRPPDSGALPVQKGEAPTLECFVGLLARAVGAPGPERIELDCGVNAAAGFRGGWRGVVAQDTKLTLGLPLVAGLDLRSFAGVLAHELGHFSQRWGMVLAWVITGISERFEFLMYNRDRWELALQDAARSDRGHVQLFAIATLALLWIARRPLWVLMWAGRGISCFALRQLEYDADGYEIVFAGSEVFRRTSRDIHLLHAGSAHALRIVDENLSDGRLPRNLPMLARAQADVLPDRIRIAVERELDEGPSGRKLFSTHPPDRDRIGVAESWGAPGLIHSKLSARELFADFDQTAERLSRHFYGSQIEFDISKCAVVENRVYSLAVKKREQGFTACERFFGGHFTIARPLRFSPEEIDAMRRGIPPANDGVRPWRRQMNEWLEHRAEIFERFERAEEDLLRIGRASELFLAGFRIRRKAFALPRNLAALSERQKTAADNRDSALVHLIAFDRIARCRIGAGLASFMADRGEEAARDRHQTRRVLRALAAMETVMPKLQRLRRRTLAQAALLQNLRAVAVNRGVVDRLQRNAAELSDLVQAIRSPLQRVPYPFEHAAQKISVAEFSTARFPQLQAITQSYRTAEVMLQRLFDLYFRLVGHLCSVTEAAEADGRLGMPQAT